MTSSNAARRQLIRLNKFLVSKGYGSRREADRMVENGWVKINGATATHGLQVDPAADVLKVDPAALQFPKTTVIYHKPLGIVSCQPEGEHQIPAVSQLTAENFHAGGSRNKDGSNNNSGDPHRAAAASAAAANSFFNANHHHHPPHSRRRVIEPFRLPKMAAAGRLDVNSTGLLVLTQCGRTAAQIIGPDSELEKEYLVRVARPIVEQIRPGLTRKRPDPCFDLTLGLDDYDDNNSDNSNNAERGEQIRARLEQLRQGVVCSGDFLRLDRVDILNEQQLQIVLRRGRKHHIRRMLAAVGWEARALKRVRIGNLVLGNLPKGQWRYLGADESIVPPPPAATAKEGEPSRRSERNNRTRRPFANRRNH